MRTGRPRKATAVKIATGDTRRDRMPVNEPQPPEGEVLPPAWLKRSKRALEAWEEYAPMLVEMGVLKTADAPMFAIWCSLYAEFQRKPTQIPANRIARMDALAGVFGLNPSARARMGMTGKRGDQNPTDELFTGPKLATG